MTASDHLCALPAQYGFLASVPGAACSRIPRGLSPTERAQCLDLPLTQVALTAYFQPKGTHPTLPVPVYGLVYPASERFQWEKVSEVIAEDTGMLSKIELAKPRYLPECMERGSCGPFLSDGDIRRTAAFRPFFGEVTRDERYGIVRKIFLSAPWDRELVDFAVPGEPDLSIRFSFSALVALLRKRHDCYEERRITEAS